MVNKNNVKSLRKLLVWQKGIRLAQGVYSLSRDLLISRIHELQKMLHSLRPKLAATH